MGTHAIVHLIYQGNTKAWYVQWDGDELGGVIVRDLKMLLAAVSGDWNCIRRMVSNLRVVDESTRPTAEDKAMLMQFVDLSVSDQSFDDWYCLLRKCQNSLINTLISGVVLDAGDMGKQEFNWYVDFDRNEFYYDSSPRFPLDAIPLDWNEQCSQ